MNDKRPAVLAVAHGTLSVLVVLNFVFVVAAAALLAFSWIGVEQWLEVAGRNDPDPAALIGWLRATLALALVTAFAAHLLLTRSRAIVRSVRSGTPFSTHNGRRLRVIAWALLAIQLLDLGFGYVSFHLRIGEEPLGWSPELTGWLAVLLLFVLASVFEQGAALSDELEGTV